MVLSYQMASFSLYSGTHLLYVLPNGLDFFLFGHSSSLCVTEWPRFLFIRALISFMSYRMASISFYSGTHLLYELPNHLDCPLFGHSSSLCVTKLPRFLFIRALISFMSYRMVSISFYSGTHHLYVLPNVRGFSLSGHRSLHLGSQDLIPRVTGPHFQIV